MFNIIYVFFEIKVMNLEIVKNKIVKILELKFNLYLVI